jgi:predicted ArsR family transcriptional regulator
MTSHLPSPDRRAPAGPGRFEDRAGVAGEQIRGVAPDMERALGALRDFTRRDILLRFYTDRKARSVDDVARAAGIHRSVAFDHLERLVALGYLEVERRRGLPGKPAKIYRLTAGPLQISHPIRRYDVLAESLARELERTHEDGGRRAMKEAGLALGRGLARAGVTSVRDALEPMIEMGAEYEVARGGSVVCTNCLFAEACRRVPNICHFHAGVIEGLTAAQGEVQRRVASLGFHDPGGCAYEVIE